MRVLRFFAVILWTLITQSLAGLYREDASSGHSRKARLVARSYDRHNTPVLYKEILPESCKDTAFKKVFINGVLKHFSLRPTTRTADEARLCCQERNLRPLSIASTEDLLGIGKYISSRRNSLFGWTGVRKVGSTWRNEDGDVVQDKFFTSSDNLPSSKAEATCAILWYNWDNTMTSFLTSNVSLKAVPCSTKQKSGLILGCDDGASGKPIVSTAADKINKGSVSTVISQHNARNLPKMPEVHPNSDKSVKAPEIKKTAVSSVSQRRSRVESTAEIHNSSKTRKRITSRPQENKPAPPKKGDEKGDEIATPPQGRKLVDPHSSSRSRVMSPKKSNPVTPSTQSYNRAIHSNVQTMLPTMKVKPRVPSTVKITPKVLPIERTAVVAPSRVDDDNNEKSQSSEESGNPGLNCIAEQVWETVTIINMTCAENCSLTFSKQTGVEVDPSDPSITYNQAQDSVRLKSRFLALDSEAAVKVYSWASSPEKVWGPLREKPRTITINPGEKVLQLVGYCGPFRVSPGNKFRLARVKNPQV